MTLDFPKEKSHTLLNDLNGAWNFNMEHDIIGDLISLSSLFHLYIKGLAPCTSVPW